ncbi:hypothetical protein [Tenacibaculum ovolyticum]|uniref:hypothetical protein n=1 Tax=Tenacibaculum ovolyticum TaxID=104270 RepID=UPI003BA8AC66
MKKILLLLIFIVSSCGRNKNEQKLYGKWFEIGENMEINITKDSIFIDNYFLTSGNWKANKEVIELEYLHNDSIVKQKLDYTFNKDTLIIKTTNHTNSLQTFSLLKAENYLDFLFKKQNIELTLNSTDKIQTEPLNNKYFIKVFLGYRNGETIAKTEYSENLKNLNNDYIKKENELKHTYNKVLGLQEVLSFEEWKKKALCYEVYIDKKIPKSIIDSKINILKNSKIKQVYQAYKYDNKMEIRYNTSLKKVKL